MRAVITLITLLTFANGVAASEPSPRSSLADILQAYSDSKALGHKADAFLHARAAYNLAREHYPDTPALLAPHAYRYATASATYREPVALSLYEATLNLLRAAYGSDASELSLPLIDAADEALTRREPEKAYAWYAQARKLLDRDKPDGSVGSARVHMGLARQYMASGEQNRADNHAQKAITLLEEHQDEAPTLITANLYYWSGQVHRAAGRFPEAHSNYEHSLNLFLAHDPRARRVLSLHYRLVETNHQIGHFDTAAEHCIAAEKYQNVRKMYARYPIYDPAGRASQSGKAKVGQILAGFTTNPDCRVRDIVIHKTVGISEKEAVAILERVYFPPRLKDGKLVADQIVEQTNIDIY